MGKKIEVTNELLERLNSILLVLSTMASLGFYGLMIVSNYSIQWCDEI